MWSGIATDFDGWRDVSDARQQAKKLSAMRAVKAEMEQRRQDEPYESMATSELNGLMEDMNGPDDRAPIRERIRSRLSDLQTRATMADDSPERRLARRVIRGILPGAREVEDAELQQFFATLR